MQISEIYKPISKGLNKVEAKLKEVINQPDDFLSKIGSHIIASSGKRIRPALVLFSAGLGSQHNEDVINLASAIELIHTASLIHNDIIDRADKRRGRETINSLWGNRISTIFGDYLLQKASLLLLRIGSQKVLSIISRSVSQMCEGEIKEIKNLFNVDLTHESYIEIVKKKTASLFSCCCETGALLKGADFREVFALSTYGHYIGIAFQITDDCLDITGDKQNLGKRTGMDIKNGKMTLPLIQLFSTISESDKKRLVMIIKDSKNGKHIEKIKAMVINSGAINYSFSFAETYISKARRSIEGLGPSLIKDAMNNLCEYILQRSH